MNISSSFEDLFMVCLRQNNREDSSSCTKKGFVDPLDVQSVYAIQRNPHGQLYRIPDLNTSIHLSTDRVTLEEIHHRLRFIGGRNDLTCTVIKNSQNIFDSNHVFVSNDTSNVEKRKLKKVSDLLSKAVSDHGLLNSIKLCSNISKRKSPSLNFGWTKTDANSYKYTRYNLFGNVEPSFVRTDYDKLSDQARALLILAITEGIQLCPEKDSTFLIPKGDNKRQDYRQQFSNYWHESLSRYFELNKIKDALPELPFEAFTVLIPLLLGAHRDVLNDHLKGMSNVIQINTSLPIDLLPDGDLKNWIKSILGEGAKMFPLSIILYSRRVIRETTDRMGLWQNFRTSRELMNSVNVGHLRRYFANIINDISSNRNYETSLQYDFNINFEAASAAIALFEQRQRTMYSDVMNGSFFNKLFEKIYGTSSEELITPVLKLVNSIRSCIGSGGKLEDCSDAVMELQRDYRYNSHKRFALPLALIATDNDGKPACTENEWNEYCSQFLKIFGDGIFVRSVPLAVISATDRMFHRGQHHRTSLKSSEITSRLILAEHLQHILFRNRINLLEKCNNTSQQPVYEILREQLNVVVRGEEALPDWTSYSFFSPEYNTDPLLLLPDYKYTFSGPVIRLPGCYDREVRIV